MFAKIKDKILGNIKAILTNKVLIDYSKHLGKALIFSLAIAVFVVVITNLTYRPKPVLKRGYEVAIIPSDSANSGDASNIKSNQAKVTAEAGKTLVKEINIEELLKTADASKGEKVFKKCAACHSIEKGAPGKIGPNLYGIVGKAKASFASFKYSDAMKAKGGTWTKQDLNIFITKPKDFVPGTKMTFAGLKSEKDRANVIAYLIEKSK